MLLHYPYSRDRRSQRTGIYFRTCCHCGERLRITSLNCRCPCPSLHLLSWEECSGVICGCQYALPLARHLFLCQCPAMHKTTFNAMDRNGTYHGRTCTVWDQSESHGKTGTITNLVQPRSVHIRMPDGSRIVVDHREVALGDNSYERYPE